MKAKLVAQGLIPVGVCGTDFANFIRDQYNDCGRIIPAAQIQVK
jgi:hypothetical protein